VGGGKEKCRGGEQHQAVELRRGGRIRKNMIEAILLKREVKEKGWKGKPRENCKRQSMGKKTSKTDNDGVRSRGGENRQKKPSDRHKRGRKVWG